MNILLFNLLLINGFYIVTIFGRLIKDFIVILKTNILTVYIVADAYNSHMYFAILLNFLVIML